jgi:adenylate kinase family enzyme
MKNTNNIPKLIILRGPSGAGKSTIAKHLFETTERDVALIEQDYYRQKVVNHPSGNGKKIREEMFETDIRIALKHGYDVIVEGILQPDKYMPIFEKIWNEHPDENYMFYFDIPFEETLRRHNTRLKSQDFGEDDMKEWYELARRSHLDWEVIIPHESSIEETVAEIQSSTGL